MLDRTAISLNDSVRVYRRFADLIKLEQEWRCLEQQAQGNVLFQSFDWCRLALNTAPKEHLESLYVITVFREETLIALLPLKLVRKGRRRILTGLAEPFQEFTDILLSRTTDAASLFEPIKQSLLESGADYVHLGQVRGDSDLHKLIDCRIDPLGESDQAPFIDIDGWADHAEYFRSIRSQTRKNIRNQKNKLQRTSEVAFEMCEGGDLLSGIIDRSYANREVWLEEKGLTSRAFRDNDFKAFLEQFKESGLATLKPVGFSLQHGGVPIAEQWGVIHQRRYYAYMMGWNPDYAWASPGKMKTQEVVRACFELNLKGAEFMIPNSAYKQTWATGEVSVQDYVLPLTPLGKLYANVWIDKVRPLAKRAVLALPSGIRRHLRGAIEAAPE